MRHIFGSTNRVICLMLLAVSSVDAWSGTHAFSFHCSAHWYIFSTSSSFPGRRREHPAHGMPPSATKPFNTSSEHLVACWRVSQHLSVSSPVHAIIQTCSTSPSFFGILSMARSNMAGCLSDDSCFSHGSAENNFGSEDDEGYEC